MRTSVILSLASLLVFAVIVYEGYRYYSETAIERACAETQAALENASRNFLLGRVNGLSSDFGMQPLDSPVRGRMDARLADVRQRVNSLQSAELGAKLSEAEVLSGVLGGYLEAGGQCSLFDNMVRMGQANVVSMYTASYKRAVSNATLGTISELSRREYARLPEKGGSKGSCGRKLLAGEREKEYCQALKSLNRELAAQIEASLKGTGDAHSVLYKSILAGCVLDCEESEPSCIADCWLAKKAVFE